VSPDWWTLGIQFLNVAILVWLMAHFFWKPVASMIDRRRDRVSRTLAEAREAARTVEAERAEVARIRSGFEAERDKLLADARDEARDTASDLLTRARKQAEEIRQEAMAEAERERAAEAESWREMASHLAVDIAGKLLSAPAPDEVQAGFLDGIVTELSELPERSRDPGGEGRVTVTSAAPLDPAGQAACSGRIQDALGPGWAVDFETDADLIAGFEVSGPSFVVRNSWRATLERIRRELDDVELA
jgi:F-type H+-transporting ATPase subunit b